MAPLLQTMASNFRLCPCCQRFIKDEPSPQAVSHSLNKEKMVAGERSDRINTIHLLENFEITHTSFLKLLSYFRNRSKEAGAVASQTISLPFQDNAASLLDPELASLVKQTAPSCNFYVSSRTLQPPLPYQNSASVEISRLAKVFQTVEMCPWYWGDLSNADALTVLRNKPIGYFLLRNSRDTRFLFSLSVVTNEGVSSMRIAYSSGRFAFDAVANRRQSRQERLHAQLLKEHEQCVIGMILFYTQFLRKNSTAVSSSSSSSTFSSSATSIGDNFEDKKAARRSDLKSESEHFLCSWKGQVAGMKFAVSLKQPHRRKFPSLQELSKFSINKQTEMWKDPSLSDKLPLPFHLKTSIRNYPYPL